MRSTALIRYFYVTYQKESSSRQVVVTTSSRFCFCRAFLSVPFYFWRFDAGGLVFSFKVAVRLPRFDNTIFFLF